MSYQYYNTLKDKSIKFLLNLCEFLKPKLTIDELDTLLAQLKKISSKKKTSSKVIPGYKYVGDDYDTECDLSKLDIDQLKNIYQIFISKELNDRLAVKWRFYQNLKYFPDLIINTIQLNDSNDPKRLIDLIIKTETGEIILVLCYDILDLDGFNNGIGKIQAFSKKLKMVPIRIIFAACKSYRNIPIGNPIQIEENDISPELWLEMHETTCPFNGEDLLIINDNELEVAGFNFTATQDLLDYTYEYSEGGQVSIYKQRGFFSESLQNEQNLELIWKGIMLKNINS
jgi:hypothetical protein